MGDHLQEDLAKPGNKLNMKVEDFKHPSIFLATLIEPYIEIWWFFLNFGRILTTEHLKKHLILALLSFNFYFWLYIGIYRDIA